VLSFSTASHFALRAVLWHQKGANFHLGVP
jgi:hypothetical protein